VKTKEKKTKKRKEKMRLKDKALQRKNGDVLRDCLDSLLTVNYIFRKRCKIIDKKSI